MEECATCEVCKGQSWVIYDNRIECAKCHATVAFSWDTKVSDLIRSVSDTRGNPDAHNDSSVR
jgi:hypothetical protein